MAEITSMDIYLFNQGTEEMAWKSLGAWPEGDKGWRFSVWAPDVPRVAVTGTFNGWTETPMTPIENSGIWQCVAHAWEGDLYKFVITTPSGEKLYKADPYGRLAERRPGTASRLLMPSAYEWHDEKWLRKRAKTDHFHQPKNIYEVHAGSWRRKAPTEDNPDGFLSWEELAEELIPYVKDMGWNYIEFMPVAEHPLDASWGYQVTGYFAPTSRYGHPDGLKALIDRCHQEGIGVILDWVPGHFCRDSQGLGNFTGKMLYESYDHPQWGTYCFDFERPQVRSFLLSNARYWLEEFHADGLRVDGVSSMLYLNFGIEDKAKMRYNVHGGEENLAAISLLQELNRMVGVNYPGVFTVAEESSAWPLVTKPASEGGLGFHYKWDMGWMNDTLRYFGYPFDWRKDHHHELTFSMMYAFSENFVLALSHDEVVHGKRSLLNRMPGVYEQQFSGLRLLLAYQMLHPGAKLSFMGTELAPYIEWREYEALEWFMLDYDKHRGIQSFTRELNRFYLRTPGLWKEDHSWDGFTWMDADNNQQNVLVFSRQAGEDAGKFVCILNFSPYTREDFKVGVPYAGLWREALNSDDSRFGGTGAVNAGSLRSVAEPMHGCPESVSLTLPPLSAVVLRCVRRRKAK